MHKTAIIGMLHVIAGASVLVANQPFTDLLSKVMPSAIAGSIVDWTGILAVLAGFALGYLAPSPVDHQGG